MPDSLIPLAAVVLGGILSIAGGYFSTTMMERQRYRREEKNLAFAFRGEISAILQLIADRGHAALFNEVIAEIEKSGKPFYLPLRVRYQYDSVFRSNADKLGTLAYPLPERIAVFYTRMASVLEDFSGYGEGTFESLSTKDLLRTYRGTLMIINGATAAGQEIIAKIDELYGAH